MANESPFPANPISTAAKSSFDSLPSIWQAPLVPIALLLTAGIVADRYLSIPLPFSFVIILACLIAWAAVRFGRQSNLGLIYLALALAAFGAAHHHWQRDTYPPDDIGNFAASEPQPVRLRGVIAEEPEIQWHPAYDPLRSFAASDTTHAVIRVSQMMGAEDWYSVSGRAQMVVAGPMREYHVGDEVEVDGRLIAPEGPANPGELDFASCLRDRHVRAIVHVRRTTRAVHPVREGWSWTFTGRLAMIRGWGQRQLQDTLGDDTAPVASALLLGERSALNAEGWEKYMRTGVIHALVISGQQLTILAGFIWGVLRVAGVRRRRIAWLVGIFLLSYALMTGGRPPAMRAAVIMGICCLAVYFRRPILSANSLALAWIVVALLNPTDLFSVGCQLSFLAVIILYWGTSRWFFQSRDPLERLIEESRPTWLRILRRIGARVLQFYAITWAILLLQAPLVASHNHLLSPVALIIGPPMLFLATIALIAGFLLLLSCVLMLPLTPLFAAITQSSLAISERVVDWSDRLRWGHIYVSDIPAWWLWVFYLALLAVLTQQPLRERWRWGGLAGVGWLCIGLLVAVPFLGGGSQPGSEELRCTFLAVGHCGCTVLEMPDGRIVLYDSGAIDGPDVTRRQIAPFLWNRGIRKIDEIILSHADLDHFNGLPALLDRFAVGQVTSTPSFADKSTPGVRETLAALERHGIPLRIVQSGDWLLSGVVQMEVLHPLAKGPEGKENYRSLVLVIRHAGHGLMLTGDLEGPGLARVVSLPPPRVDVLMAPHHGSRAGDHAELVNRTNLALLTRCQVIVSCQGLPLSSPSKPDPYAPSGACYLSTWPHGAVTIRSRPGSLEVEAYRSGQHLNLDSGL
jgi:competence protein ComEC